MEAPPGYADEGGNFVEPFPDRAKPGRLVRPAARSSENGGLEFFRQVRILQPNASRVLLTGVVDVDTIIEAINQGEVYRFLVKPWLRDELLATVRDASQRHELIGQNAALKTRLEDTIAELGQRCRELEQRNRTLQGQIAQLLELVGDQKEMIARALYNERGELRRPSR